MNFADKVSSQFDQLIAAASGDEKLFRKEAWAKYAKFGMPGRKDETWKYTSLSSLTGSALELSPDSFGPPTQLPPEAAEILLAWAKEFSLVVTVNGHLRTDLCSLESEYLRAVDYGDLRLKVEDGWMGLATALARPGFRLEIPAGLIMTKPILFVHAQTSVGTWSPTLNQIRLGRGSALNLAEIHLGVTEAYLRSEMTSVDLEEDAILNWVRVQREVIGPNHFSEVQSRLQSGAQLHVSQLNGGAAWCRSSLRADILGPRAEAHLSGMTFARGKQFSEQRVEVRHAEGHSVSTQLFKSVLKDQARGVLNGKIVIERDAQKVSSSQYNHSLLLNKGAEADTKPELEIYADDVKANHGASIGRLDESKVFYLMSRGIPRATAQQMLAHAFVGDVLMKIPSPLLRRFADACVQSWLPDFSGEMVVGS